MKLGIDLMGSDKGAGIFYEALQRAGMENSALEFVLYGNKDALALFNDSYEKVLCEQYVTNEDGLLEILRKSDSSMGAMLKDLKEDKTQGVLSAGSTAAYLLLASRTVPMKEGIKKAGLMSLIPAEEGSFHYLCDMGANLQYEDDELYQLARLAVQTIRKSENREPLVALLNVGT